MPSCGVEWARKLQGRLPENIPAGLAIAFLVAAIVLPIIRRAVSAGPQARAETLKPLEAELMKAAADKGSPGSASYDADESNSPTAAPMIQGKTNIAKGMSFLADNNNRLIGTPIGAGVSSSGGLALYLGQPRAT